MTVSKEQRGLVTDHAIVRWLERVEGYNFDDIREEIEMKGDKATDKRILTYLADKYGLFRGHVIFRIATKQVKNAIKMGAKKIHRGNQTLVIDNEQVVTLMERKR